jgi:serine/threonine-protein kinase RsbW
MKDPITLTMALPKVPDIEMVAIEGLERLSHHLGIPAAKIGEAKVVVTEAIINALEHSGGDSPAVRVEFAMTKKELTVLVRDFGKGFEPSQVPVPEIGAKMGTANKRGWGLKLMKTMSDDFHIESSEAGTKITIRKLLE